MTQTPRTVLSELHFAESPRWHDGRIWISDFYAGQVLSAKPDGQDLIVEAEVPQQPSGLGWLPDGRLLVVSMRDRTILRREFDGTLTVHADLSDRVPAHLNDMIVDSEGRAYVGNFGFDLMGGAPLASASLHRVDPDGTITLVASDLHFPNGIAITDERVLLVNETLGNRVTAFDIAEDGGLTNRRVWAEFGPLPSGETFEQILPEIAVAADGCCLDGENGLWIADATGARLLRVTEGGQITEEITPGTAVYACTLGGDAHRTLFACAAPDFYEEARRGAREGQVLAFDVSPAGR